METPTVATPGADTGLSFKPEDFAKDMAKLQAEAGTVTPAPTVETKPTQEMPVQPAQATVTPEPATKQDPAPAPEAAVEVPEKFKTPEGTLDEAKLAKSAENIDKALANYLAKEKELKRKINEVKAAENAYLNPALTATPVTPGQIPATSPNPALSFEQQLEADMQAQGAGKVLAKLFTAAQESALEQARRELMPIKEGFEESRTRQQIEAIGKIDPWVYTPEGVTALNQILDEQRYLLNAPDPYKAAYMYHRGLTGVTQSRSSSQVLTPTPTAKATAPVPSAVAANQTPSPTVNLNTREAIDAHLKTLTPKQQEEFFIKAGFPAFTAK